MTPHPPIVSKKRAVTRWADQVRQRGETIALVPTMGALHGGHLSLVELAKKCCDRVVLSIFVNPTQFGPNEDFASYPRTLETDLERLAPLGVDLVFAPSTAEMYSSSRCTIVAVSGLTKRLCGATRPGHFDGVTTVVAKLFNIVKPHVACFGEKDYQQLATVRKMVLDLDFDVEIRSGPTVREPSGLALSSRNEYLTPEERQAASSIFAALTNGKARLKGGAPLLEVLNEIEHTITAAGGRPDYIEALDAILLEPVTAFEPPVVLAVAVFFGTTRLIDNTIVS